MTATLLSEVGRALYGEHWQSPLARDLGVNPRTVRGWIGGRSSPQQGVYLDLLRLVRERSADLDRLTEPLERAAA